MFKHIVMWRIKAAEGSTQAETTSLFKQKLEALRGCVPGLLRLDAGINALPGNDVSDVVLYSEFTDKAAYEAYAKHPMHVDVVEFAKTVRTERRSVDYAD